MSDTITSYTGATPTSRWPFVTIPDFARRGQRARHEAYIEMIAFSPLVTFEDRNRWSIYSAYDNDWLGENITTSIGKDIYRMEVDEEGQTAHVADDNILMIPVWLTSPKPQNASLVNFNLLSDSLYYFLFNAMTESKHTALSAVYKNQHMYDRLFTPEDHIKRHESIHSDHNDDDSSDPLSTSLDSEDDLKPVDLSSPNDAPHSVLMAPVYDSFDTSKRSLSGIIHGILPWDSYLAELLPPSVNGIYCVLKNSCGQTFTFRIDGPHALYIGEGDLTIQNSRYDEMAMEVDFGSDFLGQETRTYRQCFYSLIVKPSKQFEATFESNETEQFTALLAVVFSALALFFLIFVWFVQRRQQKVMGVAIRTSAIISGLFPDNVRDRIMKSAEAQANRELEGRGSTQMDGGGDGSLKHILNDTEAAAPFGSAPSGGVVANFRQNMMKPGATNITILDDCPIADLYPECTVFFGDIVGE